MRSSSLLSKWRYSVPSATPASPAIAAVVAASMPSRATIRLAARISLARVVCPLVRGLAVLMTAKRPQWLGLSR